jgi:hypothetical protein
MITSVLFRFGLARGPTGETFIPEYLHDNLSLINELDREWFERYAVQLYPGWSRVFTPFVLVFFPRARFNVLIIEIYRTWHTFLEYATCGTYIQMLSA